MKYTLESKDGVDRQAIDNKQRHASSGYLENDILSIVTSDDSEETEDEIEINSSQIVENRLKSRKIHLQALQQPSSISILSSDEDLSSDNKEDYHSIINNQGLVYRTEKEFEEDINRLKLKSTKKFKDAWDQILDKYAHINDELESDEIDLATGRIVVDNGHLKSLREDTDSKVSSVNQLNIWSPTYDIDKQKASKRSKEYRERMRKKELKSRLKQNQTFHNLSAKTDSSISSSNASYFNSLGRISEDNLSLLSPSPTKKQKSLQLNDSSSFILDTDDDNSPTKKHDNTILPESPTRANFRTSRSLSNLEIPKLGISAEHRHKSKSHRETSVGRQLHDALKENREKTEIASSSGSMNPNTLKQNLKKVDNSSTKNHGDSDSDDTDFDNEYSIVEDPYMEETSNQNSISIYHCAFEDCFYCTGNKSLYHSHLLERHSSELNQIGFPVSLSSEKQGTPKKISEVTIKKLTHVFPLVLNVPSLPFSSNGEPFQCGVSLEQGKCKKSFITKEALRKHRSVRPSLCSSKKQVYMCPLLGCGYLTDGGYLEWKAHIIDSKHHIDSKLLRVDKVKDQIKESNSFERFSQGNGTDKCESLSAEMSFHDDLDKLFNDSD